MATVPQLMLELQKHKALLDSRGDGAKRLQAPLSVSLIRKVGTIQDMDSEGAMELIELADDVLGDHAQGLEHAVHLRLEAGLVEDTKTTAQGQILEHLDQFLTANDYRGSGRDSTPPPARAGTRGPPQGPWCNEATPENYTRRHRDPHPLGDRHHPQDAVIRRHLRRCTKFRT
jgi:hypothetical protein